MAWGVFESFLGKKKMPKKGEEINQKKGEVDEGEVKIELANESLTKEVGAFNGGFVKDSTIKKMEVREIPGTEEVEVTIYMPYGENNKTGVPTMFQGRLPARRLDQFIHDVNAIHDYLGDEIGLRGLVYLQGVESMWRTFLEEREGKDDKLINSVASTLHDQWRAPRKIENSDKYDPRWKPAGDPLLEARYKVQLQPGETKDNVRMTADGNIEIDIANTDYENLTPKWQQENLASAEVAVFELMKYVNGEKVRGQELKELDRYRLAVISSLVHHFWLDRNQYAMKDAIMSLPYHFMDQIAKGSLEKLDSKKFLKRIEQEIVQAEKEKGSALSPVEIQALIEKIAPQHARQEMEKDREISRQVSRMAGIETRE